MDEIPTGLAGFMERIQNMPPLLVLGAGLALAVLTGSIDALTGPNLSVAIFQLIPVFLVAWVGGRKMGVWLSVFCAGISLIISLYSRQFPSSSNIILIWNNAVLLGVFLLAAHLAAGLQAHLVNERKLAGIDLLTGALSNRAFYDAAKVELDRARRYRHPFTLVYIDLDNFQEINNAFGHSIGDAVLRTVSRAISTNIRAADILARLGGDEFALLLPETGPGEAEAILPRLHQLIMEEMHKGSWDLGMSMGATIFISYPRHVDDIIYMADQAMHKGKTGNKNGIQFTVYQEEAGA